MSRFLIFVTRFELGGGIALVDGTSLLGYRDGLIEGVVKGAGSEEEAEVTRENIALI